ncbi:MAG: hypothetical protein K2N88_03440 [Muribaculaceae bacterium]|nr:hypothetical protein [Muribaculaceae bacterium]
MKKGKILTLVLIALTVAAPSATAQEKKKSFDEFRKGVLEGYSNFRKTILDNYADFLNGEWHEYESLNGERRDRTPKPSEAPAVSGVPKRHPQKPAATAPAPTAPTVTPSRPSHPSRPEGKPDSQRPPRPEKRADSHPQSATNDDFDFFGLPVSLPGIEFNVSYRLASPSDYASQWKDLDRAGVAKALVPAIRERAREMGLNDYLIYELVKAYVSAKFPQADESSRFSAIHYLLANMGYDARIAVSGAGTPLLLLPFKQTIYARNYMMMTDGKYYVFAPEGYDYSRLGQERLRTCTLPKDADKGEKFDLVLGRLNIPVKPKSFKLEYGPLSLTGEVNENLMPILYHYPQMPIADYAVSQPDPELRRALVEQVKSQIGGMEGDEAVEQLLGFMHNVFEYATDEDFHGFEKPYFLEETLYYPKNDCEDRAIFYTYFLWNALGKEAQLITFPGHEAATVRLDHPVEGTSYDFSGKSFYISDPTFIGSHTGMVMPIYKNNDPKVDYTFTDRSRSTHSDARH